MLYQLKVRLRNLDDDMINLLIEEAKSDFTSITRRTYNKRYNYLIIQMILEKANKIGAEGLISQSIGSTSESYLNGYSNNILQQLNNLRAVVPQK